MIDILLDDSHDIDISGGFAKLTTEEEGILQEIEIRLQFFSGEWFLDVLQGIPYLDEILIKNANIESIKSIFAKEILDSENVEELISITLDFDTNTRCLKIDFSAKVLNTIINKNINIEV